MPEFGGHCACCGVSEHKKGMTFHHKWYVAGEYNHKHFGYDKLSYYRYLEPIIRKRPEGFTYLCNPDHGWVTKLRRIKDNLRISNIARIACETRYYTPRQLKNMEFNEVEECDFYIAPICECGGYISAILGSKDLMCLQCNRMVRM